MNTAVDKLDKLVEWERIFLSEDGWITPLRDLAREYQLVLPKEDWEYGYFLKVINQLESLFARSGLNFPQWKPDCFTYYLAGPRLKSGGKSGWYTFLHNWIEESEREYKGWFDLTDLLDPTVPESGCQERVNQLTLEMWKARALQQRGPRLEVTPLTWHQFKQELGPRFLSQWDSLAVWP